MIDEPAGSWPEPLLARTYVDEKIRAQFLSWPNEFGRQCGLSEAIAAELAKIDQIGLEMAAASLQRKRRLKKPFRSTPPGLPSPRWNQRLPQWCAATRHGFASAKRTDQLCFRPSVARVAYDRSITFIEVRTLSLGGDGGLSSILGYELPE